MPDQPKQAPLKLELLLHLQLLQLADSALPIGGLSHSFGLESLIEEQFLKVDDLLLYMKTLLSEGLLLEAVYCRAAHKLSSTKIDGLRQLNAGLSALRCARESREASLALGKRFLRLLAFLEPSGRFEEAVELGELHFSIAFGYAFGVLSLPAAETVAAFLHQNVAAAISAAQRLLSLGQMQSSRIAWELKPIIHETVKHSAALDTGNVFAFSHLPELASMRHPFLSTRLFIS